MNQGRKYLLFVGLGVVIWFVFLVAMRLIGSTIFSTGNPLLLVFYIGAFPVIMVTILAIGAMTGVPSHEMLIPTVIMTFTALMFDGLAVNFTDFYGPGDDQVRASAAFLLWGAGAGLICSFWLSRRGRTEDTSTR